MPPHAIDTEILRAQEARRHVTAAHARLYPRGCPEGCGDCLRRLAPLQVPSTAGTRVGATLCLASALFVVSVLVGVMAAAWGTK